MIAVSQAFKDAAKQIAQYVGYVTDGVDEITESDDLQRIKITGEGNLCEAVMRQAEIQFIGDHDYPAGTEINIGIGLYLQDTEDKGVVTLTIASPCVVSLTAHGLTTGDQIRLSTDGALPTGLDVDTDYYVIFIDNNSFKLATTHENAVNDIAIDTSGSQSGTHTLTYYVPGIGTTPEYVDYGTFIVAEQIINEGSSQKTLKCFDKMSEADIAYAITPTYPKTLLEFVQLICTELGWTLGTLSFPNDDLSITEELFSEQNLTYRQILNQIAEASASIILFNNDDELIFRQVDETSLETLDASTLNFLKTDNHYGPVNSIVLSRYPQEDNIAQQDETSISENGLTELKFFNNDIVDADRETYITPIFNALNDIDFYPYEAETVGLGYFEIGDRITLTDPDNNTFGSYVFKYVLELTGGFRETIEAPVPEKTETSYQYAGIVGQTIKRAEIKVDKVEGEITSVVEEVDGIQTQLTSITQTVNDIQLQAELTIGENLLLNSVGLKGNVREWQVFDENGDLVDVRNDGTILQTTDIQNNTESRSAIQVEDQFIQQTIVLNPGQSYTFYCKFKKNGTATLDVTGYAQQTITVDDYVDNTWGVYSFSFVAVVANTVIKIETATSNQIIVSDNIVKLGTATGWTQAPNEVYGTNYTFDREGLKIRSLSGGFSSTLDSNSLSIRNEVLDKLLTQITQDQAIINNLIAQDALTIQDSVSPVHPARFIPTPNGLMFVLNK